MIKKGKQDGSKDKKENVNTVQRNTPTVICQDISRHVRSGAPPKLGLERKRAATLNLQSIRATAGDYWLFVEIDEKATLKDLDDFLRGYMA